MFTGLMKKKVKRFSKLFVEKSRCARGLGGWQLRKHNIPLVILFSPRAVCMVPRRIGTRVWKQSEEEIAVVAGERNLSSPTKIRIDENAR